MPPPSAAPHWGILVFSPFLSLENDLGSPDNTKFGPSEGPATYFARIIPYPNLLIVETLSTIETLLFPDSLQRYPIRRATSNERNLVMILDDYEGAAETANASTHASFRLSLKLIAQFQPSAFCSGWEKNDVDERALYEIRGILLHELVHAVQWFGDAPIGLIEGIADWCRLEAGLAAKHWRCGKGGERWDEGYESTAYFLSFITTHLSFPHFVPDLNCLLRQGWAESHFETITGWTLQELWGAYKKELAMSGEGVFPYAAMPTHAV